MLDAHCSCLSTSPNRVTVTDTTTTITATAAAVFLSSPLLQLSKTSKATALQAFPKRILLVPVTNVNGWVKGANNKLSASDVTARQFEVQASFTLSATGDNNNKITTESGLRNRMRLKNSDEFAVGVRIELGNGRFADAFLRGSVTKDSTISSLSLWFDKSQAGGGTNTTFMEGGAVPLPADAAKAWKVSQDPLQLSVWVDHGVVEIFAMKGLGRLTSRIYPDDDSIAWGASAWAIPPESGSWSAQLDSEVWEMKSAWLAPSC